MKQSVIVACMLGFCMNFLFSEVVNQDRPLNGQWDFHPQRIWVVDEAGPDLFGEIQNLAVDHSQKVFVADQKHSAVFIFDSRGRFLKRFGKQGEGPGEIRRFFGGEQLYVVGDKVLFADRTVLHYFDIDGNYLKSVRFAATLKPRAFIDEHTFVSAPATVDRSSNEPSRILVVDLYTGKRVPIADFSPFEKASSTKQSAGQQMTVAIVIGDITPLMLVHAANNRIYYGMSDTYRLHICDLAGNAIAAFSIPDRKPCPVSDAFKKELAGNLGDVPANFLKNIMDGLPPHASFFSAIHVDKNGNIYLFESNPDSRSKKHVDIFNSKGEYIHRAALEAETGESIDAILMGDGFVLMATEDEDGTIKLAKYAIQLPGPAKP